MPATLTTEMYIPSVAHFSIEGERQLHEGDAGSTLRDALLPTDGHLGFIGSFGLE